MQLARAGAIALAGAALACAATRPLTTIEPGFAKSVGCDAVALDVRADSLRSQLAPGTGYVPAVGWDACDVLAHDGGPTAVDRQPADRMHVTWLYQKGDESHRVRLVNRDGRWIVETVEW